VIAVWSYGERVKDLEGDFAPVMSVSVTADGRWALSGVVDGTLRFWDLANGQCVHRFREGRRALTSVSMSAEGRWGLSGGRDGMLRLWDLAAGQCVRTWKARSSGPSFDLPVDSLCMTADGRWALSAVPFQAVRLWDLSDGRCVRVLEGNTDRVTSVCMGPDGRWGVSGDEGGKLRLWGLSEGQCVRTLGGHSGEVTSVSMSADCNWVASGGQDHTVRIWALDWEYEFPGWADWDEGVRPCLEMFLTLHCPYGSYGPARVGQPTWDEQDLWGDLLAELQYRGYGWLRVEGVRRELEKMTADWKGPPPLPGIS
jgi:WD40 repeat protein